MLAYEVLLNDRRLCIAGIDGDGVLNAMLSYDKSNKAIHQHLTVGGLISATKEDAQWICADLHIGDEVTVRIRDVGSVDEPTTRGPAPELDIENHKAQVRWWAKKFGWTVIEGLASENS